MSNFIPFPEHRIVRQVHSAPAATPHYALTDEQERRIATVQDALRFVASLADAAQDGPVPLQPEGLSALVSVLADLLPTYDDMPYGHAPGEFL